MMTYPQSSFRQLSTVAAAVMLLLSGLSPMWAQQANVPAEILSSGTTCVARIDPGVIGVFLDEAVKRNPGVKIKQTVLGEKLQQIAKILGEEDVWLTADWPTYPTIVKLFIDDKDNSRVERLSEILGCDDGAARPYPDRNLLLKILPLKLNKAEGGSDDGDCEWKSVFATAGNPDAPKAPFRVVFFPPAEFYNLLGEMTTELPDYLGGGPVSILTEGARWATVDVDIADFSIAGYVQSASNEAAKNFNTQLGGLLKAAGQSQTASNSTLSAGLLKMLAEDASLEAKQDRVVIQFRGASTLEKVLEKAADVGGQVTELNRLRKTALAILNFESAHGHFPSRYDVGDTGEKSGLSWRVHILPYMGQQELALWKKFKLNQSWDSPHNIKLLAEMPVVYERFQSQWMKPADANSGLTTMVAPRGEKTVLGASEKTGFRDISDGSSNTILLVSVKESLAVEWTAPRDYAFDPEQPAAGLKFEIGKTPTVSCDGATMMADQENQWLQLFQMNDGGVAVLK